MKHRSHIMRDFISPLDPPPPGTRWHLIEDNDHYEISEYGHVRRATDSHIHPAGTEIRGRINRCGYVHYNLHRDGKTKTCLAHRLVAIAFCPNNENLPVVAHNDGVKLNCFHRNLRWTTPKGNNDDQRKHGTLPYGQRAGANKLTPEQVKEIRAATGKQRDIAARYGVSQTAVWKIKKRQNWATLHD